MTDVLIVGAGPAGAAAGIVLARAGARVTIVDRAAFPRDKLCGDTVNPGTLARLHALGVGEAVERRGLRVDGMVVTGSDGDAVVGRYPDGQWGRAILRRELDALLLDAAVAAGCRFEPRVAVRGPIVDESAGVRRVSGVRAGGGRRHATIAARVTIGADGRRSALAWSLGLARHPSRPRRWAVGAYFENFVPTEPVPSPSPACPQPVPSLSPGCPPALPGVAGACPQSVPSLSLACPQPVPSLSPFLGEMHIRRGRYIGVAPVPGGLTNVCLVRPAAPADADFADAARLVQRELARDPLLAGRAAGARLAAAPVVLGPLAVDVAPAAIDGLLLAGDAAGFVDPMTGDGLRFAVRGGELAAAAALDALAGGWAGVHARLAAARAREFGGKWRFNRALRALVASPSAIHAATLAARVAPAVLRGVIARAGDCAAAAAR